MHRENGWRYFFDRYAPQYMEESFTHNTLAEAAKVRDREKLALELMQADATEFRLARTFDACLCLCEGAFGLLAMDEDATGRDLKILRNIAAALRPGGKFLLTALNALRTIRSHSDEDVAAGRFDQLGLAKVYPLQMLLPEAPAGLLVKEKGFTAPELRLLLEIAGFETEGIWGGTAGNWAKEPLRLDEMEIMVLARKRDQRSSGGTSPIN